MKLKNYLLSLILLITSVFSLNAQDLKKTKQELKIDFEDNNSQKGVLAPSAPFVANIPGTPSGNLKVKGDLALIGNVNIGSSRGVQPNYNAAGEITNLNALTNAANSTFNGPGRNNNERFEYVDIDSDPTTFSSSSADLRLKNLDGTVNNCKKIAYAGLYWAASYAFTRSTNPNANGEGTPPDND